MHSVIQERCGSLTKMGTTPGSSISPSSFFRAFCNILFKTIISSWSVILFVSNLLTKLVKIFLNSFLFLGRFNRVQRRRSLGGGGSKSLLQISLPKFDYSKIARRRRKTRSKRASLQGPGPCVLAGKINDKHEASALFYNRKS